MIRITPSSYPITVSDNILEQLSDFIDANFSGYHLFVLVDENTEEYCLPLLSWANSSKLSSADALCIIPGEGSKSLAIIEGLTETLIDLGATRKSLLINLGGGVVSDLGGFLAASFKRGIPFINLPTTLLAMVDASTGGKTGVNVGAYKNQIGAFRDPEAVFCGLQFLETLPIVELKSGYAEAIKHGLIQNSKIWNAILKADTDVIPAEEFVADSIRVKNAITNRDPFEKGERKKLNFGHTIGHALEGLSYSKNEPISHGKAVSMGIVMESFLSVFHAKLSKSNLDKIREFVLSQFEKYEINKTDYGILFQLMSSDKKNEKDGINFTLLNDIGDSETDFNLSEEDVTNALEWYCAL